MEETVKLIEQELENTRKWIKGKSNELDSLMEQSEFLSIAIHKLREKEVKLIENLDTIKSGEYYKVWLKDPISKFDIKSTFTGKNENVLNHHNILSDKEILKLSESKNVSPIVRLKELIELSILLSQCPVIIKMQVYDKVNALIVHTQNEVINL